MPVFKVTAHIDGAVTFDVTAPKGAIQALEMAKKLLADGLFTTTDDPIVYSIQIKKAWSVEEEVMKNLIIYEDDNFIVEHGEDQDDGPRLLIRTRTETLSPFTPQEATKTLAQMSIAIMSVFRGSGEHA